MTRLHTHETTQRAGLVCEVCVCPVYLASVSVCVWFCSDLSVSRDLRLPEEAPAD